MKAEMLPAGASDWFTTDPRVLDWIAAHTGGGRKFPAGWYTDGDGARFEVIEDGPDRCGQVASRGSDGKTRCLTPQPEWRRAKAKKEDRC